MTSVADARRRGAAALLIGLGLLLLFALTPYATGLVAIPVLYVLLAPAHRWLAGHTGVRSAAGLVVILTIVLLVSLGGAFVGLIVSEAQRLAANFAQSPLLDRLTELRVGSLDVGAQVADLGGKLVSWIGSSAFAFVGSAFRFAVNLTVAAFGVYYLLVKPQETWQAIRPYIPFSEHNTEVLRQNFRDVTASMLLGTGLTAAIHGAMVSLGFWVVGFPNAALWGLVAAVFSVLPVLGSGMVWGPGAVVLVLDHRPIAGVCLALWGILAIGNIGYVVQPLVARRVANIHPLVTLIGTLIGVPYFGLLGLLVGPLALSYFFELIVMFREEYLTAA